MYRSTRLLGFILTFVCCASFIVWAQSGRGQRPATPAPKPTTNPNLPKTTVLGIPESGKLVKQDVEGATSRFGVRNGLTVIIRERHATPLVAVNVTVKVGAVNEPDGMEGIARLVQQAVLRGTAKFPGAAIEREVARLGGQLTSAVEAEETTFSIIAPTESYQGVVELLGELLLRPAFNADELKKAAQMVLLASKRAQDDAETVAIEKLYATAFNANRLKRGSVVSEGFLNAVTREQAQAFYQNFYHPENTIVTVVGDVFIPPAIGQVQLHFANFAKAKPAAQPTPTPRAVARTNNARPVAPAAAKPTSTTEPEASQPAPVEATAPALNSSPINPDEPAQDRLRYANTRLDIDNSIVTVAYRVPALKADKDGLKEMATLQTLAAVWGLGRGSRLWQGLREGQATRDKTSVVFAASADYLALPGVGLLIAQLRIDPERIDRAEAEFFREIERFRRETISEGELQRARALFEKEHHDTLAQLEREAATIAHHQARFGDYRLFDSQLARLRTVTAADVQQAAAKYLAFNNATVHELEARTALARSFTPEKFAELIVTFAPVAVQPIRPEEIKPALALKTFTQGAPRNQANEGENIIVAVPPQPIRDFSVLRGPRAYVREDKSRPTLTVGVFFQGGRLIEDQTTSGMTELMLRAMLKSTTTRKGELIALELESYGGELQVVNEPDFFGFTLDVLSRNNENAVKLLLDVIENPFFDKDELAKERNALLGRQRAQRSDDEAQAVELLWASLYANHPYGLPSFGLPEVVKAADVEKLEAWHAKTIKRQFPLVVLVGDTDGSALVSRIFSEGLKRDELDKTLKVSLPTSYTTPQEKLEERVRQLTMQAIGFRVAVKQPDDYFVLQMIGQVASVGKLSEELHEKQSLTERVRLLPEPRLAAGGFFARLATLPENEQRAREILLAELQRLGGAPPTDDEFEQGRNATIGRYAIQLQAHPARLLEYARYIVFGRKPADVETQPDFIRAVKKADIKRVAESVLKPELAGRGGVRAVK